MLPVRGNKLTPAPSLRRVIESMTPAAVRVIGDDRLPGSGCSARAALRERSAVGLVVNVETAQAWHGWVASGGVPPARGWRRPGLIAHILRHYPALITATASSNEAMSGNSRSRFRYAQSYTPSRRVRRRWAFVPGLPWSLALSARPWASAALMFGAYAGAILLPRCPHHPGATGATSAVCRGTYDHSKDVPVSQQRLICGARLPGSRSTRIAGWQTYRPVPGFATMSIH